MNDKFLSLADVKQRVGNVSRTTIWRWERDRGFPKRIPLTSRKVVWRESEVQAWQERLAEGRTSEKEE